MGQGLRHRCRSRARRLRLRRAPARARSGSKLTENPRAQRSYEKAGFTREATLRHDHLEGGRYTDGHVMSILRDEWQSRRPDRARAQPRAARAAGAARTRPAGVPGRSRGWAASRCSTRPGVHRPLVPPCGLSIGRSDARLEDASVIQGTLMRGTIHTVSQATTACSRRRRARAARIAARWQGDKARAGRELPAAPMRFAALAAALEGARR